MKKSFSSLLLTLVFVATSAAALAQEGTAATHLSVKVIQVAIVNPQAPLMSHEVASLMQTLQKAQMQYRRSGNAQDLARVQAMQRELASRGFGRVTQSAPVMMAENDFANPMPSEQSVRVSSASE